MGCSALKPLRLEAMTLRGIGSYLHGGRLEIRPLTIISGTNGSGKSTWFRILDLLKYSLKEGLLPLELANDRRCGDGDFFDYTNAFVKYRTDQHGLLVSADEDWKYGKLGTVGLHIAVDVDFSLEHLSEISSPEAPSTTAYDSGSMPQEFLWGGQCYAGTSLRIRMRDMICNPEAARGYRSAELLLGDDLWILIEEAESRDRFKIVCTRAFWPGAHADDRTELDVGSFALSSDGSPVDVRGPHDATPFDLQVSFCELSVARIRQLLDAALRGIFWLSAIRPVQQIGYADPEDMWDDLIANSRSVGFGGQYTHALARRFAHNRFQISTTSPGTVDLNPDYQFDTYYSAWMRRLVGTYPRQIDKRNGEPDADFGLTPEEPPSGFLQKFTPDDARAGRFFSDELDRRDLNVYASPLFGEPGLAAPTDMSSGFHQIAPMVVQAGLMRANEALCIENPEVHLHPKLQLEITEFLVRQATIGKHILVETHSDLVVRRVVRAILEEEIKQEAVRVHFTDVNLDTRFYKNLGYASSRIQVIEIDDRGRIQNWPEGFMDDDIRESRRLLDVMYGTPSDDSDLTEPAK